MATISDLAQMSSKAARVTRADLARLSRQTGASRCASLVGFAMVVHLLAACSPIVAPVATKKTEFEDQYAVLSIAFSPDGTRLATSSPNSEEVHVWTWQGRPQLVQTLHQVGGGQPNGLHYNPLGTLLASAHGSKDADGDRIVRIWNSSTGAVAGDIVDHSRSSALMHAGLAFSPDGRFLMRSQLGGSFAEGPRRVFRDSFIVHDTADWHVVWALRTDPLWVSTFGLSHDGRYAAIAGDERRERGGTPYLQPRIVIVDLAQRRIRQSFDVLGDDRHFVVWSPDDRRILLGGAPNKAGSPPRRAGLEIVDAATGEDLGDYAITDQDGVAALSYSPDGKYLVIGWDRILEIWDAAHTKLLQRIPGWTHAADFSPDGRYLAISTGNGQTIDVWEMK
jgi:WD40 repeat protein